MASRKKTTKGTTKSKTARKTRGAASPAGIIELGERRELFVDNFLIERLDGVELRLHKPVPRNVAIDHDMPWEGNSCAFHTVFRDGNLFRAYYRGSHWNPHPFKSKQVICCAKSRDGIDWTKPELGLFTYKGTTRNNIVWDGVGWRGIGTGSFAPFRDLNPNCREGEEYKALGNAHARTREEQAVYAFKSADGVNWSLMSEKPVMDHTAGTNVFDSLNTAFYDTLRGCYVLFHRDSIYPDGVRYRQIMTSTSKDFRRWTKSRLLQYDDVPLEHLYTNAVTPYERVPHIYVGFPKRLVPDRQIPGSQGYGVSDALFMTSRDGLHFKRWHEAFVRPGLQRERWETRNNMPAWGILETDNDLAGAPKELSIFTTEGFFGSGNSRLRRHTLRLDGFVSANAPAKGGELLTRPFTFAGGFLSLNVSTSAAGSVRVELQDGDGKAIRGHTLRDCDVIYGDDLDRTVTWKGVRDVSAFAGKPVRLRFALNDADLYSQKFNVLWG